MKKRLAAALSAVIFTFTACTGTAADVSQDISVSESTVSEQTDNSAYFDAKAINESEATVTQISAVNEVTAVSEAVTDKEVSATAPLSSQNDVWNPPEQEFIDSIEGNDSILAVGYTNDKKYILLDSNEVYEALSDMAYYSSVLSEESYEMMMEYAEQDSEFFYGEQTPESYEEYKRLMCELYGITEDIPIEISSDISAVFLINAHSGDENTSACVFAYLTKLLCENDKRFAEVTKNVGNGEAQLIECSAECDGDIANISVSAGTGSLLSYEMSAVMESEAVSLSGRDLVCIGEQYVYADSKSLYMTAYDEFEAWMLYGAIADSYENILYNMAEESINIMELAQQLPELERLYISKNIGITDYTDFSVFKSLKELTVDLSSCSNTNKLEGLKTHTLNITGLSVSAAPLADMDIEQITIECTDSRNVLESVFSLDNVTELSIDGDSPDLSGIDKMSGLKILEIDANRGHISDISDVGKLSELEELTVMAHTVGNLESITHIKGLKKLMLHSMDNQQLDFLSDFSQLEDLTLMYVNSSFNDVISDMKSLKRLNICDITGSPDMERIACIESLENLFIMGENIGDVSGIDRLSKLDTLCIWLCDYGDLSVLKKCKGLKNLQIYNCTTPEFDASDLEGMTWLETLDFNCSEISDYKSLKTLTGLKTLALYFCNLSDDDIEDIKSSLPDCEIKLDTDNY